MARTDTAKPALGMPQAESRIDVRGATSSVTVLENLGEWHVLIVENGLERSQSFVQEDWAANYARGQRLRLPAAP